MFSLYIVSHVRLSYLIKVLLLLLLNANKAVNTGDCFEF